MYLVEVRPGLRRYGQPFLVPTSMLDRYTGFRSVYEYDMETAYKIADQGGTWGMTACPVHSAELLVDFDHGGDSPLRAELTRQGVGYEIWHSGNRSVHYHIPLMLMSGADVPARQRAWVMGVAPAADPSIYHQAGQFRLPGTFHEKNPGHRKVLLAAAPGDKLDLHSIMETPKKPGAARVERGPPLSIIPTKLTAYYRMLLTPREPGHRRPWCFRLVRLGLDLGRSEAEILADVSWWNSSNKPSIEPAELAEFVADIVTRVDRHAASRL